MLRRPGLGTSTPALLLLAVASLFVGCESGGVTEPPAFRDAAVSSGMDSGPAPDASEDGGEPLDAESSPDAEPAPDAELTQDAEPAPDAPGGRDAQPRDAQVGRDAQSAPDAGPVTSGCGTPRTSGTTTEMITVAGTARTYQLVIPNNYDPNRQYPLVFGFHGQGWQVNDFRMASTTMMNASTAPAVPRPRCSTPASMSRISV